MFSSAVVCWQDYAKKLLDQLQNSIKKWHTDQGKTIRYSFIHSFIVSLIMPLDKTQWTRRNTNMRHGVSKNNILKTHGVKLS